MKNGENVILARPSYKNGELVSYIAYGRMKKITRGLFKKTEEYIYIDSRGRTISWKPTCFKIPSFKGLEDYVQKAN